MLKIDKLQLEVIINGDPARLKLQELQTEANAVTKSMKGIKDQEILGSKKQELAALKSQMEDIRAEIGLDGMSMRELGQRSKELQSILSQLKPNTDEFKAYQTELNNVKARQLELKGTTNDAGSSFGQMWAMAGGIGIAEIATKGLQMLKDGVMGLIESTKSGKETWEAFTFGMKNGWDSVVKSIATGDFSNLFTNMLDAISLGIEYSHVMDDVKEKTRALSIEEAKAMDQRQDLLKISKDVTKSTQERMDADIQIGVIDKDLANKHNQIIQEALNEDLKLAAQRTGASKEEIKQYLEKYEANSKIKTQIEELNGLYDEQRAKMLEQIAPGENAFNQHVKELDAIKQKIKETDPDILKMNDLFNNIGKGKEGNDAGGFDKIAKEMADLYNTSAEYKKIDQRVNANYNKLKLEDDKKTMDEEIAMVDTKNSKLVVSEKQRYIKGQDDQYAYNQNLLKIEDQGSTDKINILKKYASSNTEIQKKLNEEEQKQADRKVTKLVEERKYRDELVNLGSSLVDAENKNYDDRLKKAGLFNINRSKLTSEELQVLEILEAQHTQKLEEISFNEWSKASDKANKEVLSQRKELYLQELTEAGTNSEKRKRVEEKYAEDVNAIELGQLQTRLLRVGESIADIQSKYSADDETSKQLLKKFGDDRLALEQQIQDKKFQIIDAGLQKQDKAQKDRDAARKEYNLLTLVQQEDIELAKLEEFYKNKQLTTEEYEQALLAIKLKYATQYITKYESIVSNLSNAVKGFQDAELTNLETQKQKELAAVGDNADAQKVINDKFAKEENATKKKYALKTFDLQIAQIIASTAKSAIEAYQAMASIPYVGPALGLVAAAAAVAYGASQIAQAKAQRDQVMQLASGKYNVVGAKDGRNYNNVPFVGQAQTGIYSRPTLISEYGPEMVLSAPHVRNLQMNYPAVLSAIMATRVPQLADGNYPASGNQQNSSSNSNNNDQLLQLMVANISLMNKLNTKLDNLYAKVVMDEFKKTEAQWDSQKTDVTKF